MAHWNSFPENHEIVEIENELNPGGQYRTNNRYMTSELKRDEKNKSPATNTRHISSLEEDLNQLFEVFSRRASSSGPSSSKKSASKRPVIPGGSHSPRNEISERGNLKQALRGLCLSQASEMAAMKRSTKTSRSSKAGKIMTLYRNVVVEDEGSLDDGKGGMLEISLVHDDKGFDSFRNSPENVSGSDLWPSNRSSLVERETRFTKMDDEILSKHESVKSMSSSPAKIGNNEISLASEASLTESLSSYCSDHGKPSMGPTRKTEVQEKVMLHKENQQSRSPPSNGKVLLEVESRRIVEKSSFSVGASNQTKNEVLHKDDPAPNKSPSKEPLGKSDKVVKKDSSKNLPSTGSPKVKNKKGSKSIRHTAHLVKPLVKTKNFVKRKSKNTSSNKSSKNKHCEFNNDLYTSSNSLVCPRCQCVVTNEWKETDQDSPVSHQDSILSSQESHVSYQDSPISPFASLSAEVSSGNVISDVSTPGGPSSESLNKTTTVLTETSGNSKSSISEECNVGRPSFCDRPHKSKDVRWEVIWAIRYQHGAIGLRHFNLVKKLGCGDIGTVYLAELIGTDCQFAIKVMDNEFLARRNKISRARTEREILRMLDHPFLPTLYSQFTSDNLSCLVMEFCPGGDLHVLRQRQPGRCFTEHAARFYVAEVLLALEYLHMLGVIYRDLKPENILVREDGHIMLSDFDLSLRCAVSPTLLVSSSTTTSERSKKVTRPSVDSRCAQPLCIEPSCQVTCFTPRLLASSSRLRKQKPDLAAEMRPLLQLVAEPTSARSNSFVGTHEYLAPEIIKGEGHGSAVDWWTLGIFLYELLYGRTPFKGSGNDETLANVVLQNLKFPDSPLVSLQARDLITTLLVKEPENRLGTERGAADIKQHPFFEGLNWALIRCTVPPELPEQWGYGIPKVGSIEKNNKYGEYNSGSGEHLEFEVF